MLTIGRHFVLKAHEDSFLFGLFHEPETWTIYQLSS